MKAGDTVGWADVQIDASQEAVAARREMERRFAGQAADQAAE